MGDARRVVEDVFREESGKIVAGLIRQYGDFDLAEDALQDAFLAALDRWAADGTPDNPGAWITTTARRKAIDRLRRRQTQSNHSGTVQHESHGAAGQQADRLDTPFDDDRLPLIFTCCHPALKIEAQVGLTLRTLGGLTTAEIARAFLVPEATLAQRLVRANGKIRTAHIPYRVPPAHLLTERLAAVLAVVYLVFNEGYSASVGDALIRQDLCSEAIRLARLLADLMPAEPEARGLLALLLLQDSRREARVDPQGQLITLEEQDRSLWDHGRIAEGLQWLRQAIELRCAGPYQVQAAIAAVHARAKTTNDTNWKEIASLYTELARLHPSPVVELNRAVAVAMSDGYATGLNWIDRLGAAGELDDYHLYHAARADLLRRLGRRPEAFGAYRRALELTANRAERNYLERRLTEVSE